MTKNNVLLLYTTIIALSMILATPVSNLAYAELPDGCEIGASAVGGVVNPDLKAKNTDEININVRSTNNSEGSFDECQYELISANVFVEGVLVCEDLDISGNIVAADAFLDIWNEGGTGIADMGNAQSAAGNCTFDPQLFGISGPWDMEANIVANVFNQVADDAFQEVSAQPDGSTQLAAPAITVTKIPDPIKARGDNGPVLVTWTIEVQNDSPLSTLTDCTLTDANAPGPIAGIASLGPGEIVQRQYQDGITETTLNTVDVVCLDQAGDDVTGSADAEVVIYTPAVQIVKECDTKTTLGGTAECFLTVTNESPDQPKATLTNCVVDDPAIGFGPTAPFTIEGDDIVVFGPLITPPINEILENTAFVECVDQAQLPVIDEDTVIIIPGQFAVNIEKECDAKVVLPFSTTIHCEIDVSAPVENTGPLNNCSIVDPDFGDVIASGFSLNPGAAWPTELVNREVTDEDVAAGVVENIATVTCSSQESVDNVANDDNALVEIFSVDATIEDVCTPDEQVAPGEITWTVTICNTSPDGVSGLDINTSGTIETCDVDGQNCSIIDAPEKTLDSVPLAAGACHEFTVIRSGLDDGQYTDSISGLASMQAGNLDLDAMDMCTVTTPGGAGCTPGFWKNNADKKDYAAWPAGSFEDVKFATIFGKVITIDVKGKGNTITDPTLEEALGATGGDINALARHGTAAYLNSIDAEVAYPFSTANVILTVQTEIDNMTYDHSELATANELGCTQNQFGDPIEQE